MIPGHLSSLMLVLGSSKVKSCESFRLSHHPDRMLKWLLRNLLVLLMMNNLARQRWSAGWSCCERESKESMQPDFQRQVSLLIQPMIQVLVAAFAHYDMRLQQRCLPRLGRDQMSLNSESSQPASILLSPTFHCCVFISLCTFT